MKMTIMAAIEAASEVSEVALTYSPVVEATDYLSKVTEGDSMVLQEAVNSEEDSEADRAAPDLTTRERTYPPEEEALITKREVRDHTEAVVASEAAISLREAVECMEEEVAIAEVVSKMKMTDLVLVPSQESFLLLQEGEVNLLPTTLE